MMTHRLDPATTPQDWSEYRPVSAMFVDLEGSVGLIESLGPEDYHAGLRAFHDLVTREVRAHHGQVAQYLGDGAMCLFHRDRDDMDRAGAAMSAAIAIGEAMRNPGAPFKTHVHIGIASGLALFNEDLAQAGTPVVGACINLAARLQAEALPGTILVCDESRRSAEARFRFAAQPPRPLKGFPGKTTFWQLQELRPQARAAMPGLSTAAATAQPLVGRRAELDLLVHSLTVALGGRSQSVLVAGEAGMGKSRLIQEFLGQSATADCAKLVLSCSRDETSSHFHPLKAYLGWTVGIDPGEDEARRAAKLEHLFATEWGLNAVEISDLLILLDAHPEPAARLSGDPIVLREWLFQQMAQRLIGLRGDSPALILIIEDAHWLDPSSAEFLAGFQTWMERQPILMVATQRTAGAMDAPALAADLAIKLQPLSPDQSGDLIRNLVGAELADDLVIDWVRDKSRGVPLFVSAFADFARRQGKPDTASRHLPLNLLDVFEQSLVRLPRPTRRFVQAAAVMGASFEPELIADLLGHAPQDLPGHLALLAQEKLAGARLNGTGLSFAHDLVREAIYGNLSADLRRRLHGDLADLMRKRWPDAPSHLLALHYEKADRPKDAITHLVASCVSAVRVGALREANDNLGRAFELNALLPSEEERLRQELALRSMEGPLRMIQGGPGSQAYGVAQRRSMQLMQILGQSHDRAHVVYNSGLHDWACGRLNEAARMAEVVFDLADEGPGVVVGAHTLTGLVAWHRGDLDKARQHLGQSVALYRIEEHGSLFPKYMKDFGVFGLFYSGLTASVRREFDTARDFAARAQALSEQLGIAHAMGFGLLAQFMAAILREDPDAAMSFGLAGEALARKHRFPEFQAMSRFAQGWSLTRAPGSHAKGLQMMIEGVEAWRKTEFIAWQNFFDSLVIMELVQADQPDAARQFLPALRRRLEVTGENQFLALSRVAEARLLAAEGDGDQARALLTQALQLAEDQGASLWAEKARVAQQAIS